MRDCLVSLGPNCRMTYNMREHFGVERAYPFDWWITPAASMLKMIQPGFRFHIERADLEIIPQPVFNTVLNKRLGMLMHHDFVRENDEWVREIPDDRIDLLNAKYSALFERLRTDLAAAQSVTAFVNGSISSAVFGIGGDDAPSEADLIAGIRQALGAHVFVAIVGDGPERTEAHEGGAVMIRHDNGQRDLDPVRAYAEPAHVYRGIFRELSTEAARRAA